VGIARVARDFGAAARNANVLDCGRLCKLSVGFVECGDLEFDIDIGVMFMILDEIALRFETSDEMQYHIPISH
jgi:hypothetical protein